MSLKAFHVFFMIVSIVTMSGFALWAIRDWQQTSNLVHLGLGVISLQMSVLLAWYFSWFLKKLKNFSYL